ncbi:MAG: hypothetical protein J3K34DRAFT_45183 [Monoraphidium minutum]|nr:MAG: hypothetical protein J3K34DRAFT_45183 [Monoraphidium minutum]
MASSGICLLAPFETCAQPHPSKQASPPPPALAAPLNAAFLPLVRLPAPPNAACARRAQAALQSRRPPGPSLAGVEHSLLTAAPLFGTCACTLSTWGTAVLHNTRALFRAPCLGAAGCLETEWGGGFNPVCARRRLSRPHARPHPGSRTPLSSL